jgi:hypothetical protein
MIIVSGLTAQADIVRALEKVTQSSQASKRANDLAKSPSNFAGICVHKKERSYSYQYKLHYRIGTQVC